MTIPAPWNPAVRVIFGGTFDPIHLGHLHAARTARRVLKARSVTMLPAARPGHRQPPAASIEQRWRMLCLAVRDECGLEPSAAEINRCGPSYTVDTLEALAGETPLVWCIGSDALDAIAEWHRVAELPALCHLLAFGRPRAASRRHPVPDGFARVADAAALALRPSGCIHHIGEAMLDISATQVRRTIAGGGDASALLPTEVWAYIREQELYGAQGHEG